MAKLTRAQKFRDLRESLANDKEASLSTKDLHNYENRLNNLTSKDSFERQEKEGIRRVPEEDPRYIWTAFEDTHDTDVFKTEDNHTTDSYIWNNLQEVPESFDDEAVTEFVLDNPFEDFDEILADKRIEKPVMEEIKETVAQETPVQENIEEEKASKQDTYVVEETPATETVGETPVEQKNSALEPTVEQDNPVEELMSIVEETPVVETPVYEQPSFDETPMNHIDIAEEEELDADAVEPQKSDDNQYIGLYKANPEIEAAYEEAAKRAEEQAQIQTNQQVEEETPVVQETVQQEDITVNDVPIFFEDTADNHEVDHSKDVDNSIIHQTMSEVDEYNSQKGEQTISTLTNNMVNEIRHRSDNRQPKFEEVPVAQTTVSEDEFSNTVSMEISKIMSDISNTEEIKEATPERQEIPAPVVEEHPVLTKTLEEEPQEEVVEIKNINELESTPTQNTISSTIPFVVSAGDDEEIIDDDVEEDSNTILNIILVILIVILVAVLGLIIFYILKTKGII